MRPASAALVSLLQSSTTFVMADLYTITLAGGVVLRYSATPSALTAGGHTFALGPKFERSKTKLVIGTQVDELQVTIYPEPSDLIGSVPFLQAARQGQFDGALLQLERAFMPAYGDTSPGTIVLFAGRISDIECSRTMLTIKCRSHLELLNIQMPRKLWQSPCNHVFGDAMCQFDRNSLAVTFAAAAGSTANTILGAPASTTPFALGTITGVTGANAGQIRTIGVFNSGSSVLINLSFLSPVAAGDQFKLLPGCDRTLSTCTTVFANSAHFGGFPFVPTPETAV